MSPVASRIEVATLAPEHAPGLSAFARAFLAGASLLPTAAPPLHRHPPVVQPAGAAWVDDTFGNELRARHERLGASAASLRALQLLIRGEAACVVTGQQPALLGGPLYCAYKIAGAIALARRLQDRTGVPVVPVYWCGADDSDFEEARGVWLLDDAGAPVRAELPRALAEPGTQVGGLDAVAAARIERAAMEQLAARPPADRVVAAMAQADRGLDFGERVAALYLSLFGAEGLVCVDPRSPRLLQLGRPLFLRHAREAAQHAAEVDRAGALLARAGVQAPLAAAATRSGLFRVRQGVREKLEPGAALAALEAGEIVAPSVMLRPLWQDQQLAPAAAVLGPAELTYHAQIAPLYAALSVRGASPAARPHVTLLPSEIPLPADDAERTALLAGGDPARAVLAGLATPPHWRAASQQARARLAQAIAGFLEAIDEPAASRTAARALERVRREWEQVERALAEPALAARAQGAPAWRGAAAWMGLRGVPQERAYAAVMGWWRYGDTFDAGLQRLAQPYADAVERGGSTAFVLHLPQRDDAASRPGGAT